MKYTKEQRLKIGERIYHGEISKYEASVQYDISINSARDYMRLYRDANLLPPRNLKSAKAMNKSDVLPKTESEKIHQMTRSELIDALLKARAENAKKTS